MRISSIYNNHNIYQGKNNNNKKSTTNSPIKKDGFEVSDEAKNYQAAFMSVSKTSDVRTERVEQLKQQIQDGTYNVKAEDLANKLLGLS